MPWGKHQGKPMKDVPHGWFIWQYDRGYLKGDVKKYAEENVPILRFQAEKEQKDKK